jgi:hypothetical protein
LQNGTVLSARPSSFLPPDGPCTHAQPTRAARSPASAWHQTAPDQRPSPALPRCCRTPGPVLLPSTSCSTGPPLPHFFPSFSFHQAEHGTRACLSAIAIPFELAELAPLHHLSASTKPQDGCARAASWSSIAPSPQAPHELGVFRLFPATCEQHRSMRPPLIHRRR